MRLSSERVIKAPNRGFFARGLGGDCGKACPRLSLWLSNPGVGGGEASDSRNLRTGSGRFNQDRIFYPEVFLMMELSLPRSRPFCLLRVSALCYSEFSLHL